MKLTGLFVLIFFGELVYGQIFYKSGHSDAFKSIIENGIVYVKSTESRDSIFEVNLEKYWTATPYRMYDPEKDAPLGKDQVVLVKSVTDTYDEVLGLFPAKHLTGKGSFINSSATYLTEAIGFIVYDGFKVENNSALNELFFSHTLSALNLCVDALINKDSYQGAATSDMIADHVLAQKKTDIIKNKVLLLPNYAEAYVKEKELAMYSIKSKAVTNTELLEILNSGDVQGYTLLYVTTSFDLGNFAIYDLETKGLIYYRRFAMGYMTRLCRHDLTLISEN